VKDAKANNVVAQPAAMTALLAEKRNKSYWALVDWEPTFVNGWEDLQLKMYFPHDGLCRFVRIAAVFECFP
jgi:hypothetical protein